MIDIIWEDDWAMVVSKPCGLLTTAARGIDSLEVRLLELFRERSGDDGKPTFGLPHRIDRGVSGAVLIGKTRSATRHFCAQFQSRKIEKTYLAVVEGDLAKSQATWEDWMRKIPDRAAAEIVPADHPEARQGILHYETVATAGGLTCLKITLETGRTHQIRLQASHRGLPIVGDHQYGSQREFGTYSLPLRERPIALHAWRIGFRHPKNGRPKEVFAPLPELWTELGFGDRLSAESLGG